MKPITDTIQQIVKNAYRRELTNLEYRLQDTLAAAIANDDQAMVNALTKVLELAKAGAK